MLVFAINNKQETIDRIERGFLPGFEEDRVVTFGDKERDSRIQWPNQVRDDILLRGGWVDVMVVLARCLEGKQRGVAAMAVLIPSDARDGLWDSRGKFKAVDSGWDCFDSKYYICVRNMGIGDENKFVGRVMRRLY